MVSAEDEVAFVVAGGHGPVALELVDGAFDNVALLVLLGVEARWAAAFAAAAGPVGLSVARFRDRGRDPTFAHQTRSMLRTPQRFPRAGSQDYPTPAATADPDGSTTIYFGPQRPDGVAEGNWVQTDPDKGWFQLLRLYSPLPAFFDKTWRPGEIEPLN